MPEVSVVIPFYSGVEWLKEAVDSVISQSFSDYEIIVVNDGSDEDMTDFIKTYSGKIKYIEKENAGPSSARNAGIELSQGTYIAFLDSDDRWLPNKLEIQISQMKKFDAVWSYCGYRTFGTQKSVSYKMTNLSTAVMQRYNSPQIATPCVAVKRQYLAAHPEVRFNASLRYGQDSYFWLMINSQFPILALPDELVEVRIRGTNASKRARVQLQARSNVWKFRKENKAQLIDRFEISSIYKLASELCVAGDKIVSAFDGKFSGKATEFISKSLFVIPWTLFKIDQKRKGSYD